MDTNTGWTQSYEVGVQDGFECQGEFTVFATLEPDNGASSFSIRDEFILQTGITTITDTFLGLTPATLGPQTITIVESQFN